MSRRLVLLALTAALAGCGGAGPFAPAFGGLREDDQRLFEAFAVGLRGVVPGSAEVERRAQAGDLGRARLAADRFWTEVGQVPQRELFDPEARRAVDGYVEALRRLAARYQQLLGPVGGGARAGYARAASEASGGLRRAEGVLLEEMQRGLDDEQRVDLLAEFHRRSTP